MVKLRLMLLLAPYTFCVQCLVQPLTLRDFFILYTDRCGHVAVICGFFFLIYIKLFSLSVGFSSKSLQVNHMYVK